MQLGGRLTLFDCHVVFVLSVLLGTLSIGRDALCFCPSFFSDI